MTLGGESARVLHGRHVVDQHIQPIVPRREGTHKGPDLPAGRSPRVTIITITITITTTTQGLKRMVWLLVPRPHLLEGGEVDDVEVHIAVARGRLRGGDGSRQH
jgi:hypothetical protein